MQAPSLSLSRRGFLKSSGTTAAGLALVLGTGRASAEDRRTVRCGFVGVGNRGTTLLRATIELPNVEVAGICDHDAEHRRQAVEIVAKAGGARPDEFEDWRKLLEREDVEAVVSALPCDLHYPLYRDVLAAEKHLYGEKPMCLTVPHANDLVERATKARTVFQVGFQRRFSKLYQASMRAFQGGIIGAPFEGRGVRFGSGGPFRNPGEWFSFRARSGDWMLEQAVHHWDGFTWALGELPASAYGAGRQDIFKDWDPERDVSDYYTATIRYRSGLILTWSHTWASPPDRHFSGSHEQLVGPKGAIDLSEGYVAFRRGASPDGRQAHQLAPREEGNRTQLALAHFFDCIRTGSQPAVGASEGRDATVFGLLVRKAVYEERTVGIEEILRVAETRKAGDARKGAGSERGG